MCLGLLRKNSSVFVNRFSTDISSLKHAIVRNQCYYQDYSYSFNPMKIFPLIFTQIKNQKILMAPIPIFLVRRFTEGIYYEIHKAPNFSKAFGEAFQHYVGEVLHAANIGSKYTILPE